MKGESADDALPVIVDEHYGHHWSVRSSGLIHYQDLGGDEVQQHDDSTGPASSIDTVGKPEYENDVTQFPGRKTQNAVTEYRKQCHDQGD